MSATEKYQDGFADCYVLTDKRATVWIDRFLDKFVPNREQRSEEFEIPQYSNNPTIIFEKDSELIDYLVKNKNEKHTLYWMNKDKADLRGVMIFFTIDGHMIPGISCNMLATDDSIEEGYLRELKEFWGTDKGYITFEQPAPHDKDEFLKIVNSLTA